MTGKNSPSHSPAAKLLNTTRSTMVNQSIFRFILKKDREVFCRDGKHFFEKDEPRYAPGQRESAEICALYQRGRGKWQI